MGYLVLSRKYRPRSFGEVIGQSHITRTLEKAIGSSRVAQAYIFSGTRGTGKTTMARILAKALNCAVGPTASPCNSCEICAAIDSGQDVDVVEIDGASHNSVEDMRELRANAGYTPARSRYKIYYIDEVHMLSAAAFNALLKVLEEPPAHVKFIFATTEPHKIPLTIQSRCQRFDFRNISAEDILKRLSWMCGKEGINADDGALSVIARFAAGSMRDAESLLDQVVSFAGNTITGAAVQEVLGAVPADVMSLLLDALAAGQTTGALEGIEKVLSHGTSPRQFVAEFVDYVRDCLVAKTCGADSKLLVRGSAERGLLAKNAADWQEAALVYAMQLLSETYARMARSPQTRGLLDVAIIKLARVDDFLRLQEFFSAVREGVDLPSGKEVERALPFEPSAGGPAQKIERLSGHAWQALVTAAAAKGALVGRILQQHASVKMEADTIRISLPGNFVPHKAALEKPDMRSAIEEAVSAALGRRIRLEVACDGANGAAPAPQRTDNARKKALREQVLLDPAVRRILEVFDGNLIDVEE